MTIPRFLPPLLGLVLVGWLAWWSVSGLLARRHEADRVIEVQQTLIEALEANRRGQFRSLVSRDYADDLGHSRDTAVARLFDFRGEFATLELGHEIVAFEDETFEDDEAVLRFRFGRIRGQGGTLSPQVMSQVRKSGAEGIELRSHWRREGFWPGRWRLTHLDIGENLRVPSGYNPERPLRAQARAGLGL